ncbi:hypothetical protein GCM10027051_31510 [Niabella terrae]
MKKLTALMIAIALLTACKKDKPWEDFYKEHTWTAKYLDEKGFAWKGYWVEETMTFQSDSTGRTDYWFTSDTTKPKADWYVGGQSFTYLKSGNEYYLVLSKGQYRTCVVNGSRMDVTTSYGTSMVFTKNDQ